MKHTLVFPFLARFRGIKISQFVELGALFDSSCFLDCSALFPEGCAFHRWALAIIRKTMGGIPVGFGGPPLANVGARRAVSLLILCFAIVAQLIVLVTVFVLNASALFFFSFF
jgi:hypothetical protein